MQNDNFMNYWVDKLDKFDWGYAYSDDGGVYRKGKDELDAMTKEWESNIPSLDCIMTMIVELKERYNKNTLHLKETYSFCSNLKMWDELVNDYNSYPNKVISFLLVNQNKESLCN